LNKPVVGKPMRSAIDVRNESIY